MADTLPYDSDEEDNIEEYENEELNLADFYKNYSKMKKDYKTLAVLSKYEKTRILSERTQQLASGSISYLKNPESYDTIYDIALMELNQKKLPFIVKRTLSNSVELWKLEDLKII
jgi:DNA-directed RNA polymerase subunit K/omega